MAEYLVWLISIGGCGFLFVGIGIFSILRKSPMHFWSDTKVLPEQLVDIKGYNRENGVMWILYGIPYFIIALLYFLWPITSIVLLSVCSLGGIPILILNYRRITRKYFR